MPLQKTLKLSTFTPPTSKIRSCAQNESTWHKMGVAFGPCAMRAPSRPAGANSNFALACTMHALSWACTHCTCVFLRCWYPFELPFRRRAQSTKKGLLYLPVRSILSPQLSFYNRHRHSVQAAWSTGKLRSDFRCTSLVPCSDNIRRTSATRWSQGGHYWEPL